MELKLSNKNHIAAIQEEYRRVDGKWLRMQYQLMICMVAFTAAAELVMFLVLCRLGVEISPPGRYFAKYLLVPLAGNFSMALASACVMRSGLTEKRKIYIISILLAVMAFLVYTVHSVFPTVFAVFIIPMLATVIYGDQRLTALVALLCIVGKVVSDLFLFWDPDRKSVLSSAESLVDFGLSLSLLLIFYGISAFMILVEREKNDAAIRLEQERQRYQEEAVTDQLTRVWNRQALRQMFQRMEKERAQKRFFLAMMDLDDFKNLNDTYGHSQGDRYLRALGEVLLSLADEQVTPFRFGGDEFCVIFSGCEPERVENGCRAIQECFARAEVNLERQPVTLSIGVAEFRQKEPPGAAAGPGGRGAVSGKTGKGQRLF